MPLDNWICRAWSRLIALGHVDSSFLGIRPWTLMECARLVEETQDPIAADDTDTANLLGLCTEMSFVNEF